MEIKDNIKEKKDTTTNIKITETLKPDKEIKTLNIW